MAITRGFGVTFDFKNDTTRHWTVGADGVKRWADTNEPVENHCLRITGHNRQILIGMSNMLKRLQPGYGYGVPESDVQRMEQWIADMIWTCEHQLSNSE